MNKQILLQIDTAAPYRHMMTRSTWHSLKLIRLFSGWQTINQSINQSIKRFFMWSKWRNY